MTRYVLAYFVCKLVFAIGLGLASLWIKGKVPNLSIPANLLCASLSMSWFVKRENQPLTGLEILNFSIGTVLADLILTLSNFAALMWISSAPISWEGLDAAVFGGGGNIESIKVALKIAAVIGTLEVFFISAIVVNRRAKLTPYRRAILTPADCCFGGYPGSP